MATRRTKTPFQELQELAASGQISRRDLMRRALILGLTTPAVVALLSACGDDDDDEPEAPGVTPAPDDDDDEDEETPEPDDDEDEPEDDEDETPVAEPTGGVLRLVDGTEPNSLDPPIGTGPFGHQTRALFEPLLLNDEELVPGPLLATDWEIDEETGTTWTFHLKEGVLFHDGSEMTSTDVKYTIDRILDPDFGAGRRALMLVIQDVNDDDPYTAVFTTDGVFPDLHFLLADRTAGIVSSVSAEEMGPDDFGLNPVGTGPFRFVEWMPGDHVTLERFEDYHDGPIGLEGMFFRPVSEASSREAMMRAGEADIVRFPPLDSIQSLQETDGIEVLIHDTVTQVTSEMRQSQPPFSHREVRQAMNYAIDSDAIIEQIMNGLGEIADSPALPGIWAYEPQEPYSYDPDRARELLAEAGYPDGFEGDLFYVSGRWAGDDEVTEAMQAYWAGVGININLHRIDMGSLGDYLRRDPDEYPGWTTQQIRTSAYQDYHLYRLFHSESTFEVAAQRSHYLNPEVDELIDQARATFDEDEREDLYRQVQRIVWDDAAFVWVFVRQDALCYRTGVTGFEVFRDGEFLVKDVQLPD
jgi:glutathione transport system substrate-binding protein